MADAYGNVSVLNTPTVIVANLTVRRSVLIKNNGSAIVYLGFDASVTTSNGMPLMPQDSIELGGKYVIRKSAIYGISGTTGQDVRYLSWDQ